MDVFSLDIKDHFDVMDELSDVVHKWRPICAALRLPPPVLNAIKSDNQDAETCLEKAVTRWLNQSYNTERFGLPSWKMLVDAVAHHRGGDNPALAQQIAERHNGKTYVLQPGHIMMNIVLYLGVSVV